MIYFIQKGEDGPIKIGITDNLKARVSSLRTGGDAPLHVLATMEGDSSTEEELHTMFAEHRRHGEWFNPEPRLLVFIDEIKTHPPAKMQSPEPVETCDNNTPPGRIRYLSSSAWQMIEDVIFRFKEQTGITISASQAIGVMYKAWERAHKGDDNK